MTPPRTFRITTPEFMEGEDIRNWQQEIEDKFQSMGIDVPIEIDGVYGLVSRSRSRSLANAMGLEGERVMQHGVTPELRTQIRQIAARGHAADDPKVLAYRRELRAEWGAADRHAKPAKVSKPVGKIVEDSWGFHPGVHDGLDVITLPDAPIFAMVKSKVIDVRSGGWWGLGAPSDPALRGKGDGIIQLEILETVGPFVKGRHIGYGHAEKAVVHVGQIVNAGQPIGHAGFANAWHIHLMYNTGATEKGIGNLDPRAILDWTKTHG